MQYKPTIKHFHLMLLAVVAILLTMGVIVACNPKQNVSTKPLHEVVVIHSWDSIGEEGKFFQDVMAREFEEQGLNVNIHHFYCNMMHRPPAVFAKEDWDAMAEEIHAINPKVILLNDDPIVECVLSGHIKDSLLVTTPVVFAGVNALQRDSLKKFPLMKGFDERIDLVKNLEMIANITKKGAAVIELDYERADSVIRAQLYNILGDTVKYVNNGDFHLTSSDDWIFNTDSSKTVVHFISVAYPNTNRMHGEEDSVGKDNLQKIYKYSKTTPQLQVKYDVFSNSIIDRSHNPQFTCIREQFNNDGRIRFLGGYFTSTELQVEDQVEFAARMLKGENPRNMSIKTHRGDYYMDWNAMRAYLPPLSYSEYSKTYHIINAPYELESPLELTLIVSICFILVAIVVYTLVYNLTKWKSKGQQELIEQLTYEEKIHNLIFSEANDTVWRISDDMMVVEQYFADHFNLPSSIFSMELAKKYVHPDSLPAFEKLRNFRNARGRKVLRMKLSSDGKEWHWVEIVYTATDETADNKEIYGLLLNIDHKKSIEEKLEQAQILSSEVALKENFLANISHDLKTPLGAITGFSEMLAMPGMKLTEKDRADYCAYIHQNTEMILSMIDDVMHKARTEDATLEILRKPVEISKLINDCYQTNLILAPTHLQFHLETDTPDCMVDIDLIRTKQVINNFLSNAFKFTVEGDVTLGWRYVDETADDKQWVEVYVTDTGIGVDPDNKDEVFDRYVKVNETDRGTGLGLNISKTIVEKQGGIIGCDSKPGVGSTFYFRLQTYVKSLLLVLSMAFCAMSTTSCLNLRAPRKKANVVVVHSYDKQYYAYPQFNETLRQTLVKNGIDPTIRHLYLDLENPRMSAADEYKQMTDSLRNAGWKADLMLAEGDRAGMFLLDIPYDSIAVESRKLPIVLGALHHPEWERIRKRPNIVAINDPIDYVANINLAVKLTGMNVVEIELDYFPIDSLIRKELRQAINRPPFADNTDYHMGYLNHVRFDTEFKDSIVVLCYSAESPERNTNQSVMTSVEGYKRLGTMFTHAWRYPSLSLKKDIYSTEIIDKTGRPQFTAIKAGFADNEARYLCGYFSAYTTVAQDVAKAGADLLKGTSPTTMTGLTHHKDYYMDYNAMKALGMKYSDYNDQFIIVNAPLEVTSPALHYGFLALIIIVLITGICATILIAQSWKERSINDMVKEVKRRSTIRNMAINGANSRNVRSEETLKEIIASVHPDHAGKLPLMQQSIDVPGPHFYDIYADIDKTGEYHWWQLRFAVMFDHKGKHVDGILFNIDTDKQREHEMTLAVKLAEEAKQKEDFLTTISHELRTPLNAVVGFSDVMATLPREQMTDEELLNYGKIIKNNNNVLRGMIEDILMFSRIESHRLKYINKEFHVKDLIEELAAEWRPRLPEGVNLHVFYLEPEIIMNNDRTRMKYILGQMLSNAIKFTEKGTILLGVMFHYNDNEAEFIVGDTGCGISREKQSVMFGLFWKDNEFVPGLGLGLHIAYKLAEGMGLRINVESKEGYGTKMLITGKAELRLAQ